MPRPTARTLEDQLAAAADRFASEVVALLNRASVTDLSSITGHGASTSRASTAVPRRATAAASSGSTVSGGRSWPTCSEKGCTNRFFPASGTARLCYQHFIASGGAHPSRGKKRS